MSGNMEGHQQESYALSTERINISLTGASINLSLSTATSTAASDDIRGTLPVTMIVLFTLIATLGILGNTFVLFVFVKVPELRIFTNILIANQSIVDLTTSVLLMATFIPPEIHLGTLYSTSPFLAHFVCKIWVSEFIYWAVIKISTTNLVCLTLERYIAIVHPLKYRTRADKKTAVIVCLSTWIIGAATAVYFPITHYVNSEDGECTKMSLTKGASVTIALLAFLSTYVFPLLVMIFVYVSIFCVLRPNELLSPAQVTYVPSSSQSAADLKTGKTRLAPRARGRRNVLITMVLVCVVYAVCWTPDQILYLVHNLVHHQDWSKPFHRIAILLAASNVCTNPLIYALKYRSFQRGMRKVFHRFYSSENTLR